MFSQKEFIAASRSFVCVRLESYESKEHQDLVRRFLDGRFANTAFCLLSPDGEEKLSRSGRSPSVLLRSRWRTSEDQPTLDATVEEMQTVARKFKKRGEDREQILQDFHSFRQALNVASGDQRLLIAVSERSEETDARLKEVLNGKECLGRFHLDFLTAKDEEWMKRIEGKQSDAGIFIIRADRFGQKGSVMKRLKLDTSANRLRETLVECNRDFAGSEERKIYGDHVREGRRMSISFENAMPYGEDRDGDGVIDYRGRQSRR
ncbi:MAG: hypothetical protein Q7Q71_15550 [Verrucomicrobiota bacterium JB023]|nr:hypothetical protein [Verrucomicrobiota bacterium JB023]